MVTNLDSGSPIRSKSMRNEDRKKAGPVAVVKFGSTSVPVYRLTEKHRSRFAISYYRDGKRMRQVFSLLDAAKKEAQIVAQQIQSGMQHMTDLKPHDRDAYLTACKLLDVIDVPLVSAVEDFVRSRKIAGTESLAAMVTNYSRHFGNIIRHALVPDVVAQIIASKQQDGVGSRHLGQIRTVLNRFAAAHPGPILEVTSSDIDAWLRSRHPAASH
jgi:hypothetical protein